MTKAKNALLSALLLCLASALCFVAAEVAWRLLKGVPLLSRDHLIQQSLDLIHATSRSMVHDPQVGWRLKEHTKIREGIVNGLDMNITTGEYGLRMSQPDIIPPATGSILAVGDSFTAGSGVRDEQAWPAVLERSIGQRIANGAAGGYGVDQIVLRAEQLLPVLRPTTVIVGILSQDILRTAYSLFGGGYKPYFVFEDGAAVLKGLPVPVVASMPLKLDPVRSMLGYSHIVDSAIKALGLQQWWIDNRLRYRQVHDHDEAVKISCYLMERLARLKTAESIRVVVVVMYGAGEIEASPAPWFVPPVIACAKQEGLEVLDTYEPIRAVLQRDRNAFVPLWLNEGGVLGHLSAQGNRFVADLVQRTFFAR